MEAWLATCQASPCPPRPLPPSSCPPLWPPVHHRLGPVLFLFMLYMDLENIMEVLFMSMLGCFSMYSRWFSTVALRIFKVVNHVPPSTPFYSIVFVI